MNTGERINMLEKEIRHSMKALFGKGPEQINIKLDQGQISILLGGFLTKAEMLRMQEPGGVEGIRTFRYLEMKKEMENILKSQSFDSIEIDSIYLDVHPEEDRGCFLACLKK